MKRLFLILLSLFSFTFAVYPLSAQEKTAPLNGVAGQDERTRLMQEYMARRAEWIELRRATLDKIKASKDDSEKKRHIEKLAEDEKPILARINVAASAYRDVEKARHDQSAASKPRN